MKIVYDNKIPYVKGVLEKFAEVVYLEGNTIQKNDLLDVDALIVRTRTKCNAKLLEGTKVKFIASATIGFDHIDTEWCTANNIFWTNSEGCNSSSVLQYVAAALFHLSNKLNFNLQDKTIGIVGVGNVGKKVADFCKAIGMNVLLNDPPRARNENATDFVDLETIVEQADIITFHVPLNRNGEDKTFHLADQIFLSKLKKHQILINSSRGEVVDNVALKSVLQQSKIAAAVLDVWENEPDLDLELLKLVDIGTPHIAGYSADGKVNASAMCVQALSRFFKLGIDNWFPETIPTSQTSNILIDCDNFEKFEMIGRLIDYTYDIKIDDKNLRESPQTFEKQRNEYYIRREAPAYSVKLVHGNEELAQLLRVIGFMVKLI